MRIRQNAPMLTNYKRRLKQMARRKRGARRAVGRKRGSGTCPPGTVRMCYCRGAGKRRGKR